MLLWPKKLSLQPVISDIALLNMEPPKVFTLEPGLFNLSETDSTLFNITLNEAPTSIVVLDMSNPDITGQFPLLR